MAVSSAFAGAKVETLLLSNTGGSSSLSRLSQIPVLCKPSRTRRALIQRGGLSIRCEIFSDVLVDPNTASVSPSSSLSALEQLKASAADRHAGLTPQAISVLGGFRPQGKNIASVVKVEFALTLQEAGCFSVVLECVLALVASVATFALQAPTIGIGAWPFYSGQVN